MLEIHRRWVGACNRQGVSLPLMRAPGPEVSVYRGKEGMMRVAFRLTWLLILGLTAVSLFFTWRQARMQAKTLRKETEQHAQTVAESLRATVEPLLHSDAQSRLPAVVARFGVSVPNTDVAVYDDQGQLLAATADAATRATTPPPVLIRAMANNAPDREFVTIDHKPILLLGMPLHDDEQAAGGLLVMDDATYMHSRTVKIWRDAALRLLAQMLAIVVIVGVLVRRNIVNPIGKTAGWMRALRTGVIPANTSLPQDELFRPLAMEVTSFARTLTAARATAEKEAQLRHAGDALWTRERLAAHIAASLDGSRLIAVSNREPYMHRRRGRMLEAIVPASGLVTALEPILNACDGTWVAHGAGDADRETVDARDRVRVPPERPQYTLRRVWLRKEEEDGYYYGFSNEGLWPLCHLAHTRPIFRASDWKHYEAVNAKFADAVAAEIEHLPRPIVFAQDYHFALLPRLLKRKRPDARIAIFWHIPWPNPEAFGICPWAAELLDGLLGADLIGFHVQQHCRNFLETVDRTLECRIDWASTTALRNRHCTKVKAFPISIDFEASARATAMDKTTYLAHQPELLARMGVEAMYLGVGVDRIDYTKGIPERFQAIERLLEKHPSYQGKFTFVQIGAPSRTHLRRYQELIDEVRSEAERINLRFQSGRWRPIILLDRHHSHEEILPFYRAADVCLVTALHDGMNLVAKEFLAARADEEGMLVLSRFAGASQELQDAVLVNPYDIEDLADSIHAAIEMDPKERRARMQRMRKIVKDHNIYRWAAMLIGEVGELRHEAVPTERPTAHAAAV